MPLRQEPLLGGSTVKFPQPGRVTLVDFWATSCEPCKAMMPRLERLWQERREQGLDVIGVASDDNPGLVIQHLKALGVTYPNVVDAAGGLRGDFRVGVIPHTVVIDRRGCVRHSADGGSVAKVDELVSVVTSVLAEAP